MEPEPTVDAPVDTAAALAETLTFLTLGPGASGDGGAEWIGDAPDWFGDYLFGGFVIAQSIIAATRNAPEGRRLHSLHVLRDVNPGLHRRAGYFPVHGAVCPR